MRKFKKILAGLGLGAMLMFGAVATVSASEGELEGDLIPQSEEIVLENYDIPEGKSVSSPPTNSVKMTASSLTSFSFKWGASSDANGYRVYFGNYKASLKDSRVLGITRSPKCTIAKLVPNTPYTIRVQAVKLDSNGHVIDKCKTLLRFNAMTKEAKVNKVSCNKDGKFTIRMYNPSPNSKNDDIVGYRVRYENVATKAKSIHHYDKSRKGFYYKPKPNYFYKLTITPYITTIKNGTEKRSYSKTSITHYIAQQPRLSKKGHTNTSQSIGWKKVNGATSYTVLVKYPGTKTYKKVAQTKGLSYTLSNMKKGQSYLIKVVAQRGRFLSSDSVYYRIKL